MGSFFAFDGTLLLEAIHATGLSVPSFAREAKVSRDTLERALRGERVRIDRAAAIVSTADRLRAPEGQSLLALQASRRSA